MGLIYAINNLITADASINVSSEDSIYTKDKLYNIRPSYPFRFLGDRASVRANPEYICVDFGQDTNITLVAVFNHNLLGTSSGADITLKAADLVCPGISGAGDWDLSGNCVTSLLDRLVSNHRNFYKKLDCVPYEAWLLEVDDVDVQIPQIGELFMGQWAEFSGNVRLTPGRTDGPEFIFGQQQTHWGQDWVDFRSESEANFTLQFTNLQNQNVFDEFHLFLRNVAINNGKFVFIPNDSYPFVYYVVIKNVGHAVRNVSGSFGYLKTYDIELRSLTEGISLIS